MKALTVAIALVGFAAGAHAGGFAPLRLSDPGETCYTWTGGNFSAGSFSKCQPSYEVVVLNQLPPPVLPSPIMMPMSAPVTCAPPPKPVFRKHKPAPKKC
jgi:hypothetical protein